MRSATFQPSAGRTADVVGYIRISTEDQTERRLGLAIQESQIKAFCKKLTPFNLKKIYKDAGIYRSAIENRPSLLQLLQDAKKKRFSKVIVPKLDHIASNTFYTLWIEKELKKSGVELYSIAEPYRWDDPAQKIFLQIISAFAEYEKTRIVGRMYSGRKKKLESGQYAGGRPAYGYRVKDGKLLIRTTEAEVVRKIRKLRMGRMSFAKIATVLNKAGVKPKTGKRFYASTVHYILHNRIYKGIISYGMRKKGVHRTI